MAVVTGASRGIGRHTALALAAAGYDVAVTGRTVVEGGGRVAVRVAGEGIDDLAVPGSLQATAVEIEVLGTRALPVVMDLTSRESVIAAADVVLDRWGRIDVLVNNGYVHLPHQRLLDVDEASLLATWRGNFVHQLDLVRHVLPRMVAAGGGTIVSMASGSATTDPPSPPGEGGWGLAYAASKAAFGRIAGAVNAEYRSAGVRAFNVDPGFVVTESGRARGGTDDIEQGGFPSADPAAAGRVIAWLAGAGEEADAWLGRTIWAPKLAAHLAAGG